MNTLCQTEPANTNATRPQRQTWLTPPANIRENKDGYVLEVELPGVANDGLEITVENNELVIVGRRKQAEAPGELVYRESRSHDYRRAFELDPSINSAGINASLVQGVLTLTLPKAESVKPRKIAVGE